MQIPKSSVLIRARTYLENLLGSGELKPGDRLPSINVLAKQALVSRVPMWRAINQLKEEGKITVNERGAMRLGLASEQPPQKSSAIWMERKKSLVQDIINGRYSREATLPSIKQLQVLYGCSYGSMKKALVSTAADGLIVPYRNTYKTALAADRATYRPQIVFLSDGSDSDSMYMTDARMEKLVENLESQALRMGVRMVPMGYNRSIPDVFHKTRSYILGLSDVEGFIVNLWPEPIASIRQRQYDILSYLISFGKPVAILDESGAFQLPAEIQARPILRIFRIAGDNAGVAVARHLLAHGHRNMVFISGHHALDWSKKRLRGITRALQSSALDCELIEATRNEVTTNFDLALAACDIPPKVFETLYHRRLIAGQYEDWIAKYRLLQKKPILKQMNRSMAAETSNAFSILPSLTARSIETKLFEHVLDYVMGFADYRLFAEYLKPLFDKALAISKATVWIAVNDVTAVYALAYLAKRGKKVPNDISVIGFDNNPSAFGNHLTTFDFNMDTIAHRLLHFVRTARPESRGTLETYIEVEGMIFERQTVGRAK